MCVCHFKELFSSIGTIKRVQYVKKGLAEIVYAKLEDARRAIAEYNGRELDGYILNIELATKLPISEKLNKVQQPIQINKTVATLQPQAQAQSNQFKSSTTAKPIVALPQRLNRSTSNNVAATVSPSLKTPIQQSSQLQQPSKTIISSNYVNINKNNQQEPGPLQFASSASANQLNNKVSVDLSVIHQALFNKSATANKSNTNPVTFTVKI